MSPIFMNIYTFNILRISVPTNMISLINDKNLFSAQAHFMRKNGAEQTCSYNKIVILRHFRHYPTFHTQDSSICRKGMLRNNHKRL